MVTKPREIKLEVHITRSADILPIQKIAWVEKAPLLCWGQLV